MEASTRPNSKSSYVILVSLAALGGALRDIQKTAARETNVISVSSLILFVMAEKPPSMTA